MVIPRLPNFERQHGLEDWLSAHPRRKKHLIGNNFAKNVMLPEHMIQKSGQDCIEKPFIKISSSYFLSSCTACLRALLDPTKLTSFFLISRCIQAASGPGVESQHFYYSVSAPNKPVCASSQGSGVLKVGIGCYIYYHNV